MRRLKGGECALEPHSPRCGSQPSLSFVLLTYTSYLIYLALVFLPEEQG